MPGAGGFKRHLTDPSLVGFMEHRSQRVDGIASHSTPEITYTGAPVNPGPVSRQAERTGQPAAAGRGNSGAVWFLASLMLLLAAWFLGPELVSRYQYAVTRGRIAAEYENATKQLANAPLDGVSTAYQLVAQKIRPSVVSIHAANPDQRGRAVPAGGQGSGVIMSGDGYILTNRHVVNNAGQINVMLDDRREYRARLVGSDERSDLAVLRIEASGLFPAEWGSSDDLQVGSMVWAVGSPYGLQQTVTSGILSAKERMDAAGNPHEFLQTDAAINPGNSGGPLVNAQGQVVGINTSIYGESFLGISFAVPSSVARFVFEQIVDNGSVTRGFLGIQPRPVVHNDLIEQKLPDLNGAVVARIPPGGPAAGSDLRVGDIIRRWDGKRVTSYNTLYRYIGMSLPRTRVRVDVIRGGESMTLTVSVGDAGNYALTGR